VKHDEKEVHDDDDDEQASDVSDVSKNRCRLGNQY